MRLRPERKRNRPLRWTGSGRVRERFEAVEIPLKRTNQSQKARQALLLFLIRTFFSPLPSDSEEWTKGAGNSNRRASAGYVLLRRFCHCRGRPCFLTRQSE